MSYPNETNPLQDHGHEEFYANLKQREPVPWTTPGLRITRLRLLTEPGYPAFDVSYCHGIMPDGATVIVSLPFGQVPRRGMSRFLVEEAKRDGVYAKGLGVFDAISMLY